MFSRIGLFDYVESSSSVLPGASESKIDSKLDAINTTVQTAVANLDETHKNPSNPIKIPSVRPKQSENSEKKTVDSKLKKIFWAGLGCWSTYNLIDRGLASFLVMETLTHGTGPLGYIGINMNGADPNYGGGKTGSSVGGGCESHILNSQKQVHVFKDTEFALKDIEFPLDECKDIPTICLGLLSVGRPRFHAVLSGMANFGYSAVNLTGDAKNAFLGGIAGLLTPTLKFRFTPDEVINCGDACIFENDPDYNGFAYRTTQALPASRLGMTGSLTYGVNSGMFNRMHTNPQKMLMGVTLLAAGILLGKKTYDYYKSDSEQQSKTTDSKEKMSFFQKQMHRVSQLNACNKFIVGVILNTL